MKSKFPPTQTPRPVPRAATVSNFSCVRPERMSEGTRTLPCSPSAAPLCSEAGTCSPWDQVSCSFSSGTDLAEICWARPEPWGWAEALLVSHPPPNPPPHPCPLGQKLRMFALQWGAEGARAACGVGWGVPPGSHLPFWGPSDAASTWDIQCCVLGAQQESPSWGW